MTQHNRSKTQLFVYRVVMDLERGVIEFQEVPGMFQRIKLGFNKVEGCWER